VFIPTIIALFYYSLIASPQYITSSRFAVRNNQQPTTIDALTGLGLKGNSSTTLDAYIINSYIYSLDGIRDIEKEININTIFSKNSIDILSRLEDHPNQDELLKYWKRRIKTGYDANTGIIDLDVSAFNANDSLFLSNVLIKNSEGLVNSLSVRAQKDSLKLAEADVNRAETKLTSIKDKIRLFRTQNLAIDPTKSAEGQLGIINTLEGELAKAQAELISLRSYARSSAPAVQALEAKIQGLKRQISNEEQGLSFNKKQRKNDTMPDLLDQYESLLIEREFAERLYASALTSLESARAEANKQQRYLVVFVKPILPDEPTKPKVILDTLSVFIVAFLIWGIGSITIASTKDHLGWV
jgi:capsular polysaccharide transport system permease protein